MQLPPGSGKNPKVQWNVVRCAVIVNIWFVHCKNFTVIALTLLKVVFWPLYKDFWIIDMTNLENLKTDTRWLNWDNRTASCRPQTSAVLFLLFNKSSYYLVVSIIITSTAIIIIITTIIIIITSLFDSVAKKLIDIDH